MTARDVTTGTITRWFADPLNEPKFGRYVGPLALSSDGRLLAAVERDNGIWVYETASGRVVRRFQGHTEGITDLTFTPDGSKLISVSRDHTGLVWGVSLPTLTDRKAGPLSPKELAVSWDRLAVPDPAPAWSAIADLAGSPTEAVGLLADRLKSLPVPTAADLDRIEKQLAAEEFADREKASAELDAFGPNAVAPVQARLKTTGSPEVSARFNAFLSATLARAGRRWCCEGPGAWRPWKRSVRPRRGTCSRGSPGIVPVIDSVPRPQPR